MSAAPRRFRLLTPVVANLFTPKLITVLRDGYRMRDLRADAVAGLTVAIVALPLSMAIAVASGVTPDRGLYAAIVGGFIVSFLGGSRYQIGGPAGAFIVLVAATVQHYGVEDTLLATFLSGLILVAGGLLRFGTLIKYIPHPVTVGFTSGIAVIIFASQLRELLGLSLADGEPGPLLPKLIAIAAALRTAQPSAIAVAACGIAIIFTVRRLRPRWPALLIAVSFAALAAWMLGLPVETIRSRFGGIPSTLPAPHLPLFGGERVVRMLPAALSFAFLGAIESLLSAVVADSMSGGRHRSNVELVAQGFANVASAMFGGICVTGTIARTATNVRAGARGPFAGMLHAAFLLVFMLVAAPLAGFIPLPALGAVLAVVAWNMAEREEFASLLRASWADAGVLLATFLLVVFRDLTQGILAGVGLSALLFLHRMAQAVEVEHGAEEPDLVGGLGVHPADRDVVVYRITGAFFFGAAANVANALDRAGRHPKAYVLDITAVPSIDSTAAATLRGFVRTARRHHAAVYIAGARPAVRHVLLAHGIRRPLVRYRVRVDDALAAARAGAAGLKPGVAAPSLTPAQTFSAT